MIRFLTAAIIGLAALAASASPVRLVFSVEPAETLPSVPVAFRVRAINTGSVPATLPVRVHLEARTGAADWQSVSFATSEHDGGAELLPLVFEAEWPSSIELAPGEARTLDYLPGPSSPPWIGHKDLLKPATYRLRLVTWSEDPPAEPITSNEVLLTIQVPTGEDAGAWELISGLTNVTAERSRLAEELWSRYPNSIYTAITPRRVPLNGNWSGYINSLTEALAKNPPPGFADSFKHGLAYAHLQLMGEAMHEFDVQKAFQQAETARTLLQELVGKETEAELKAEAAKLIEQNVLTLAQIEYMVDQYRFRKPAPVCERVEAKRVRSSLVDLATEASGKTKKALADAIADLDKYDVDAAKNPPDMHAALASLDQAASRIESAVKNQWIPETDGTKALKALTGAAELSARKAIDAASNESAVKQSDLDLAKRKYQEGLAAREAADFRKAISRFREALHKAQGASSARGTFC